jgi:hypothetical protein
MAVIPWVNSVDPDHPAHINMCHLIRIWHCSLMIHLTMKRPVEILINWHACDLYSPWITVISHHGIRYIPDIRPSWHQVHTRHTAIMASGTYPTYGHHGIGYIPDIRPSWHRVHTPHMAIMASGTYLTYGNIFR